jgi:hydroxymethylbilane synthase
LIRIGTRGSKLALWQANYVKECLINEISNLDVSVKIIKTSGDKIQNKQLSSIGGKGLFVKEIEEALISDHIDIAVHSMKDVPSELPVGLHIGAVIKREDPRDVFISRNHMNFYDLPAGATIGTGSFRRRVQIMSLRDDLDIRNIRGNVDTRLSKLSRGEYNAIVLASAGIKRLGMENQITHTFSLDEMIPSPGQGIIGIECRKSDITINEILDKINDNHAEVSANAERNFVRILGGDCNLPLACHCEFQNESAITITGLIASIDGNKIVKHRVTGKVKDSIEISTELTKYILARGGKEIIEAYRQK